MCPKSKKRAFTVNDISPPIIDNSHRLDLIERHEVHRGLTRNGFSTLAQTHGFGWHDESPDSTERGIYVGSVHNATSSRRSRTISGISASVSAQSSVTMSIPSSATNSYTGISSATNKSTTVSSATTDPSISSSIDSSRTSTDTTLSDYELIYNGPKTIRPTRNLRTFPPTKSFETPLVADKVHFVRRTATDVGVSPSVDDPTVYRYTRPGLIPLDIAAQNDRIRCRPEQFETHPTTGTEQSMLSAIPSPESATPKWDFSEQTRIPLNVAMMRRDITHRPEQYETIPQPNRRIIP